jgi:hypothetical protein
VKELELVPLVPIQEQEQAVQFLPHRTGAGAGAGAGYLILTS